MIDIPESNDPTDPRLVILSEASVRSNNELLMADFLRTTALPLETVPLPVPTVVPVELLLPPPLLLRL